METELEARVTGVSMSTALTLQGLGVPFPPVINDVLRARGLMWT